MSEPTPDPGAPPIETLATPRRPPWRRGARLVAVVIATAVVTGAICLAGAASMWRSEAGSRWLLRHLPGITAVDVHGSFGSGDLRVGSLRVVQAGAQVDIADLHVTGLDLHWHPHPGTWLGVAIDDWDAATVSVEMPPAGPKTGANAPPTSLRSPVALDVARLRVGTLTLGGGAPLREVHAALALGTQGGQLHRVDRLSFDWERVRASGRLLAQTDAPLNVDVVLDAHDVPGAAAPAPASASAPALPHWAASATLRGPLAALDFAASLRGEARAGRAAPHAQASARVTPFAPLPVSEVLLNTTELDLSALSARAPATRLEGSVRVATTRPAAFDADLRNRAPAAWSSGGLPFSALAARLEAPWTGESISVPSVRLALADEKGAGGELRAQGKWDGDTALLQLDLDQVQPERLDAHLGAWRISGPLRLDVDHLPRPGALWGASPADKAASAAGAGGMPTAKPSGALAGKSAGAKATPSASAAQRGQTASGTAAPESSKLAAFAGWNAHLTGRLAGTAPPLGPAKTAVAPPPMTLQLDALLRADALQVKQLELKAGAASVSAQATLRRGADASWQGDASASWARFDPGTWWRLAQSGPLRTGPNLLGGTLTVQLASAPDTWQGLAALRGRIDATLAPSQLAGLPLEGKASLDASAQPWALNAELRSGANQAHAEGTISPGTETADAMAVVDRLHLSVDAPALATFAPLAGGPAATPATAPSPGPAASAVTALATADNLPAQVLGKAATKVATGGQTSDTRALAPALAPSASARVAPAGQWPTRGSAKLDLSLTGGRIAISDRRPGNAAAHPLTIVTQGELSDWDGPALRIAKLQWNAQGSTDPQAPLAATVTLRDGQWGITHVAHADIALTGSLAEHRLQVLADAPVSPPQWLAHLANVGAANATRLEALLQGRYRPGSPDVPAWQGRLAQFDVRAANLAVGAAASAAANGARASAASAASAPTVANSAWVHLQPVDLSFSRDAAGDWQTLRVGAGQAEFAGLSLNWQPSSWTAPALPGASAHWAFDAALAPFTVAQLMARAQPDIGWHGDLQMTAHLHAAFDGQWHVDAQLARTGGDLSVSDVVQDPGGARQALGLTAALLQVHAEGVRWQADAELAGTRLGELSGHWLAEAPSPASLPTADSPLRGTVKAHVADLNVWGAWLPPGWRLGGELRTEFALGGRWGAPRLTGQLTAQQLVIRNALQGVYAHDGDVALRLTGDQAQIERFHILGGNGDLSLTGSANLGAVPVAKLQLQANQFQLLGRIDRKIVASGTAGLQLGAEAIRIDGKLKIDEGLFDLSKGDAPTLDSDVEVVDGTGASADAAAADATAAAPAKVDRKTTIALDVDLGDHLRLKGRGIDTLLHGALQLSAPNGQLAVRGNVRTDEGQYTAYGQKLRVTRGELTFTGPVGDPRLDILATRPNLDVTVGVAITGSALAPHVKLFSEPEMSDADKLSWLMLGRAPEGLGGADTALLQQAAIALLAGEDEAPTDQLLKRLGLTDFSFRQQDTGNDVRQTVVTLGRQISRRWYVGYERGVNATTGNWQLIYRIAQRVTVRAQSGEDNSLDVIWTWRWN